MHSTDSQETAMIDFECGECGETHKVVNSLGGKQISCRHFGYEQIVGYPPGLSGKAFSILSIVFGSLGLALFPCGGCWISLVSLFLGLIGVSRCRDKKLAIIGIVLSCLGLIVTAIVGQWILGP